MLKQLSVTCRMQHRFVTKADYGDFQIGIPAQRYRPLQKENAGEKAPDVSVIRFRSRKRLTSGQRSVEQPS